MSNYWQGIDAGLSKIAADKPQTFDGVKAILDTMPGSDAGCSDAFFGGSGGDRTLSEALHFAGWRTVWAVASYYYCMRSPSGDLIEYVEGDVYHVDEVRMPDSE